LGRDLLAQPFRPLPIRAINLLGRVLARLGIAPIELSDEALMRAVCRQTQLSSRALPKTAVSTNAGMTSVTLMPKGASSRRRASVAICKPLFVEA